MLTLGLDVGTQSTKCVLFDADRNQIISRGAVSYGIDSQRHGQAEQDPAIWIQACKDAIAQALQHCEDPSDVRAIAVSGQQHGLVVLDAAGLVIRPAKLWCDLESAEEAKELSETFKSTIVPSFTVTKLLWLKRNEPEHYSRIAHVLLPHDYINYWLTGAFTMEASDASGIGVFDSVNRQWDGERIAAVDPALSNWLPPRVLGPNECAGTVRGEVAAELGLAPSSSSSRHHEILVGVGGGDNAMSALGVGAVQQGVWVLSLGTSGTLFGPAQQEQIIDASGAICAFCDATGAALPLLCTVNCTGVTEEVRRLCGSLDHDELAQLAAAEPPGCQGVTFLPYLGGERTPNWPHATGALLGLRPQSMRPGLIYRAGLEGATYSLFAGMQQMKELGGGGGRVHHATELRIVGGGAKNATWRQIIADTFQLPLRFPVETETAALGAALQAAAVASHMTVAEFVSGPGQPKLEAEVLQPNAENAAAYSEAFERFTKLGKMLFGSECA